MNRVTQEPPLDQRILDEIMDEHIGRKVAPRIQEQWQPPIKTKKAMEDLKIENEADFQRLIDVMIAEHTRKPTFPYASQ